MAVDTTPIDRAEANPPALDWDGLVTQGLATLERLAGETWTDYNDHDPGLTLLDALAFALTDLGYRAGLPIEDLLTDAAGRLDRLGACFYTPPEIYPCEPVTANDLRKVLLDELPGLANVWFEEPDPEGFPGRFRPWLLAAPGRDTDGGRLASAAQKCLSRHRQLGDFFEEPAIVPVVPFRLACRILAKPGAMPADVMRNLQIAVVQAISPPIPFRPHAGPEVDGPEADALFTGPLLSRGFIDDASLWEARTPDELPGIVAHALASAAGVEQVLSLDVPVPTDPHSPATYQWDVASSSVEVVTSEGGAIRAPLLDVSPAALPSSNAFRASELFETWAKSIPSGTFSDVGRYEPVQELLPAAYGLQRDALPPHASERRVAQVRQLRAYLFVFEQLLAIAFRQLAHAPRLLSNRGDVPEFVWQPLYALAGADAVLAGAPTGDATDPSQAARWEAYRQDPANPYARGMNAIVAGWNEAFGDTDVFLDHLLARFGESMPRVQWQNFETAVQKRRLLAEYPVLGAARNLGLDLEAARDEGRRVPSKFSGLERRVNTLLSAGPREPLRSYTSLPPAGDAGPHFTPYLGRAYYLVEHGLLLAAVPPPTPSLRPDDPAAPGTAAVDPDFFALRLTHVLTNWTYFPLPPASEPAPFRDYVENHVAAATPAHLRARFCWLESTAMDEFTRIFSGWYAAGLPGLEVVGFDGKNVRVRAQGPAYALYAWLSGNA